MSHSTCGYKKPKLWLWVEVKLDSVQCVKDLGASIASNLEFSHQCNDSVGKVNKMLLQEQKHNSNTVYQLIVRTLLEYAMQFWLPFPTKDIAKLEAVQGRATKRITCREIMKPKCVHSGSAVSEISLLTVLKYLKASPMWVQASCSQLIIHHEQGVTVEN